MTAALTAATFAKPVVALTPTGRDSELLAQVLEQAGLDIDFVGDTAALTDRLQADADQIGTLLIATEALDGPSLQMLTERLQRQPSWSNLPVVMLTESHGVPGGLTTTADPARWMDLDLLILPRPVDPSALVTVLRTALRHRARQVRGRLLVQQVRRLNERLERRVERRTQQLRTLAIALAEAEQRERERLSEQLHDDLQQMLVAAKVQLEVLGSQMQAGEQKELVESATGLLEQSVASTRSLSQQLHPPVLAQAGLAPALHWLGGQMHKWYGLVVKVEADGQPRAERAMEPLIFGAARELLFNVVKHAEAKRAELVLRMEPGGSAVLVVRDDGKGFEPAQLTPDVSHGIGLFGLRERVEAMNGRLDVESPSGGGSVVRVRLPGVVARDTPAEPEAEGPGDVAGGSSPMAAEPCKVMVVDDHPAVRRGVEAMVRRQRNIRLLASAGDGARALQQAAEDPPDVVLMDVSMPGLSGVETTRLIKQASPGVRVIGLSAWSDPDTLAAMLAAGAEQLLGKDVSEASLADAILNPPEAG